MFLASQTSSQVFDNHGLLLHTFNSPYGLESVCNSGPDCQYQEFASEWDLGRDAQRVCI